MTPPRRMLDQEEALVHRLLMEMADAADTAVADAMRAFEVHDLELARTVIDNDRAINRMQREIEDECITTVARQQPMATDLRKLVSDMNIASELERIADHGADIAKIVVQVDAEIPDGVAPGLEQLTNEVREMLVSVMKAYQANDRQAALDVAGKDDEVDTMEHQLVAELFARMELNPAENMICTKTMWIAHNLERIADRVTNIAERIAYITTGESVELNR